MKKAQQKSNRPRFKKQIFRYLLVTKYDSFNHFKEFNMSKLDKVISKFFDNLRKGRTNAFTKSILQDPKARKAVKDLEKQHKELGDIIRKRFAEQNSK